MHSRRAVLAMSGNLNDLIINNSSTSFCIRSSSCRTNVSIHFQPSRPTTIRMFLFLVTLTLSLSTFNHRVDSVIESSLQEIIGRKNFALINLSLNFCETTIYDNKVFLENLVAVH